MTRKSALKTACKSVGAIGRAVVIPKDVIAPMVPRTEPFGIVFLLGFELQKQGFDIGQELIGSSTGIGFGAVFSLNVTVKHHCVVNGNGIIDDD